MLIKNIYKNTTGFIHVNLKKIEFDKTLEIDDSFKTTQEFKNILREKYIEVVTIPIVEEKKNDNISNNKK